VSPKILKRLVPGLLLFSVLIVALAPVLAMASGGGGEGAAEAHGDSSQKLWDLLWRTMNFAAVVAVLFFLLRKPISQGLRNRRTSIKEELESLEAKKEEAQKELEETRLKIDGLAAEKEEIISELKAQGEREGAKILAEATEMAARIEEQARLRIDQEVQLARAELTDEIADLSVAKAVELVQKNITAEDQDRLVEESLNRMTG
jgi:F-type H+-transporting ATPase subunit b